MADDDFIVVGPQASALRNGSRFIMFRWEGYRDAAQGYREISNTIVEYTDMPLQVLLPQAARRLVPNLTSWIQSVIEDHDGRK